MIERGASFVSGVFSSVYSGIMGVLPEFMQSGFMMLVFALLVSVIAIFIWYFYKSLSQKNLIELDLRKYNTASGSFFGKFFAVVLYLIENALIMPFVIFVWFLALSFIILLIAEDNTVQGILILTGVMVLSVRILAYYSKEISQDLAKLFPFITLSIFLLTPGAFNFVSFIDKLVEIPLLVNDIFSFFLVIYVVEIVLRIGSTFITIIKGKDSIKKSEES